MPDTSARGGRQAGPVKGPLDGTVVNKLSRIGPAEVSAAGGMGRTPGPVRAGEAAACGRSHVPGRHASLVADSTSIDQSESGSSYYLFRRISPSISVERVTRPAGCYTRRPNRTLFSFSLRPHARSTFLAEGLRLQEGPVTRGECCFVPSNKTIVLHASEEIDSLNVFVDDDAWSAAAADFGHLVESGVEVRTGVVDPLLAQFSTLLLQELEGEKPGSFVLASSIVNSLLVRFLRLYVTEFVRNTLPNFPAWKISLVQRYIDENIGRDLPLAELASVARMSTFHFARVFKQATGQSPHSFIVQRRLATAKAMLTSEDQSIAQVAFHSGYENQGHFTKMFVRHFGMTPRAYRQQSLGGAA